MADVSDLRSTVLPKLDQLNAEQLLAGPLVITVTKVTAGGGEDQPVSIFHDTDPARPFRPCKTMRRVLILAWGPDGTKWIGRSMELFCDQSVKFGGEAVGGIRISRLTDIPKDIKVSLTATKGRKTLHEIGRLELADELKKVLEAIGAATGKESLQRAKAMAEKLIDEDDIATARAAYKKKVEALKEKAAGAQSTPTDRPDTGAEPQDGGAPDGEPQEHPQAKVPYSAWADKVLKAADSDARDLVLDQARTAGLPADQLKDLARLAREA